MRFDVTAPEFKTFARKFRSALKKDNRFDTIKFSIGHFYFSGFVYLERTDSWIYFSSMDVRGKSDEGSNYLYRTATGPTDYTGGHNNFTTLADLIDKMYDLAIKQ